MPETHDPQSEEHMLEIRFALPEDLPWLVDFNCRLAEETEGLQLDRDTVAIGVQRLLARPTDGRYLVACAAGEPVGQLMHTREWSDWRNGYFWWLQSVYVSHKFRQKNVFRRLLERLQRDAESTAEVVGLRLYVERENVDAQQVYARLGFRPAGYHVLERRFTST